MFFLLQNRVFGSKLAETDIGHDALWAEFVFIVIFCVCLGSDVRRFWLTEKPKRSFRFSFAVVAVCAVVLWWCSAADQLYLQKMRYHLIYPLAAFFELPGLLFEAEAGVAHFRYFPLAFCFACAATLFQPSHLWISILLSIFPLLMLASTYRRNLSNSHLRFD